MGKNLIIKTGLYPDAPAIERMFKDMSTSTGKQVEQIELQPELMKAFDWDELVEKILQANKVITT